MSRTRLLTPEQEERVRADVALRKTLSTAALAREYGVSKSVINLTASGERQRRDAIFRQKMRRAGIAP